MPWETSRRVAELCCLYRSRKHSVQRLLSHCLLFKPAPGRTLGTARTRLHQLLIETRSCCQVPRTFWSRRAKRCCWHHGFPCSGISADSSRSKDIWRNSGPRFTLAKNSAETMRRLDKVKLAPAQVTHLFWMRPLPWTVHQHLLRHMQLATLL